MKKIKLLNVLTASIILFSACGNAKKNDPNHIKVGIAAGLEQEIAEAAKKEAKEKYNLDVELVTFNDYVIPNEALNNNEIDANSFQHVPYLEEQSKQRGYKLAVVGKTFVYPIVGYSAMGGAVGAGGLGQIGYQYGYVGYNTVIMNIVLVLLILLVFSIQFLGDKLSKYFNHR